MSNNESRIKKILINTASGILAQGTQVILNFILRTVFIYTLGVQYTGVSSVFTDILTMLSLSELGVGTAISTALYAPLKNNDKIKIRKLMSFYRMAYRVIAVVILVTSIIMLPVLDRLITNVPDITENIYVIFMLYIIKSSVSYLMIYKSTLLNADQKQYVVKLLETICIVTRYVFEIVILMIFKQYMLYLITEVVATIIQNFVISKLCDIKADRKRVSLCFCKDKGVLSKKRNC